MLLKLELKKIWNPKILLIIIAIGLLFGFLFLEFPLRYFPNGYPAEEQYQLMLDWTEKYGAQMDDAEYKDALEKLKKELGVTDENADATAMIDYASKSNEYLQQYAGALFEYEIRYERLNDNLEEGSYHSAEQMRVEDIIKNEKFDGILPYEIMGNAFEYWRWVSVFMLFSVMVFLAPTVIKDTLTGVRKLQYTSKRGRAILKTQLLASLLSAIGLILLELLVFGSLFARLGTWRFWNNPINSFYYGEVFWFDLSFGQFLLSILLLIVLFTVGSVGFIIFFSCFSRNYISLMLKMIPAFLLLAFLSNSGISYSFSFTNPLYLITGIKGIEICVGAIVLLIGIMLGLIALKYKLKISDNDGAT